VIGRNDLRQGSPRRFVLMGASLAGLALSGCTTTNPDSLAQHDPFEPTNRAMFSASMKIDKYFAKPVAQAYVAVVPEVARDGVHNFLGNLNQPVVFGDNVLQGEPKQAAQTVGRFVVNSTVGVGGLIDVASKIGIPDNQTDFGITLGKWGLPEGPYLFLPVAGPLPPRDILGTAGDYAMDPLTWIKFHARTTVTIVRGGMDALDARAQNLDTLDSIERTSVDFYATTRSLYRQHRNAQISGGKPDLQNLPNY
jgi:phospholipid-binding lipoprotein MlaA